MFKARTYLGCPHQEFHQRGCPPNLPADPWIEHRPYHDGYMRHVVTALLPVEPDSPALEAPQPWAILLPHRAELLRGSPRITVDVLTHVGSGRIPRTEYPVELEERRWVPPLGMYAVLTLRMDEDGVSTYSYRESELVDPPQGLDPDRLGIALQSMLGGYRIPTLNEGWREQEADLIREVCRRLEQGIDDLPSG